MTRCFLAGRQSDCRGFSLIETLAALFLMGLILSALAHLTSQWMPGWDRGFLRIERSESIGLALERLSGDLAAAEFMRADRGTKAIFFDGNEDQVTFVRSAIGPNVSPGLDVVRLAQINSGDESRLIRSHARFAPGPVDSYVFSDPVVLLRSPFRVSFAFAGKDRAWKTTWHDSDVLPREVLVTMRSAATDDSLGISRVVPIHLSASAEMTCRQVEHGCGEEKDQAGPQNNRADR